MSNRITETIKPKGFDGLVLEPKRVLCALHALPFKEEWPKGVASTSMRLLDIWLDDPTTKSQVDNPDTKTFYDNIHRLLDEKPLCCRVEKMQLLWTYIQSPINRHVKCYGCKSYRPGFNIETGTQVMIQEGKRWQPICFHCLLHKVQIAKSGDERRN